MLIRAEERAYPGHRQIIKHITYLSTKWRRTGPSLSAITKGLVTTLRNSLLHKGIPHYTKGFLTTQTNSLLHKRIPYYTKGFLTTQRDSLLHKGIPCEGCTPKTKVAILAESGELGVPDPCEGCTLSGKNRTLNQTI